MSKVCRNCQETKPYELFSICRGAPDGHQSTCKVCAAAISKQRYHSKKEEIHTKTRAFKEQNRERVLAQKRQSHAKHKDEINARRRAKAAQIPLEEKRQKYWYNQAPEACSEARKKYRQKNREKILAQKAAYRARYRDTINAAQNKAYRTKPEHFRALNKKSFAKNGKKWAQQAIALRRTDPQQKLAHNLRSRTRHAFHGKLKATTTQALLGCTWEQARAHIEAQFKPGMSWDNYTHRGWHIDHIRPLASFDLADPEQQRQAFHYTNLQPLWAHENLSKGAKLPEALPQTEQAATIP
jgi:hypothetical protein